MHSITSTAHYRQRAIKCYHKKGATRTALIYKVARKTIYEWLKKYDGTWQSLKDRSHRPHSHPNQHTEEEKQLILRHYAHNKTDRMMLWDTLVSKGYTRTYAVFVRYLSKLLNNEPASKLTPKKPKSYKRAEYPGQKIQIDVKYVPTECITNGNKYYQYTAVDECTRWTYREMYDEHSTHSSADFIIKLVAAFPYPIREVQTDNGTEFTTALLVKNPDTKTLFESALADMDILYHRIRIATPQHNGKVERQHGLDEKRFYRKLRMYNLADGRKQLSKYNLASNKISKICLKFKSPNTVMELYLGVM